MARFTYRTVSSSLHDGRTIDALVADYLAVLRRLGGEPATDDDPTAVVLVATGGTERRILDWWERLPERRRRLPLFLLTHPGHNSLPSGLETLARLHQMGARGRIIYLAGPDDPRSVADLASAIDGLRVREQLEATRIGLAGRPSDWLVASTPSPETVRQVWGPELVDVPLDTVYDRFRSASDTPVATLTGRLHDHAARILEPSAQQLRDASALNVALETVVADRNLQAVAVRCFDLLEDISTSGCVALSALNDAGVVAGCEGDVVSTIGMLWGSLMTGETPWMANPAQVDVEANSVLLAHCTVPRSVVDAYGLRSHFESDSSVGIEGFVPPGPVTLLRIGGVGLDRLWLAEGEIRPRPHLEGLCRTQIDVHLSRGSVDDLLTRPLGNHVVIVAGHHADALRRWWETFVA